MCGVTNKKMVDNGMVKNIKMVEGKDECVLLTII